MLTVEIELLTGRYAATKYNEWSAAEWPPHPARFFSALVAALHDNEPCVAAERDALQWLERQPPPALDVDEQAEQRRVLDVFVPVNDVSLLGDVEAPLNAAKAEAERAAASGDKKAIKGAAQRIAREEKKLATVLADQQVIDPDPTDASLKIARTLLPSGRTKQARWFPVAIPERAQFSFIWNAEPTPAVRSALDQLCSRVTRLGHSSSLVRCAVVNQDPLPTLVPHDRGKLMLRTVGPGQLEALESEFKRHRGVERRQLPARPAPYAAPSGISEDPVSPSVFSDDWIVFERVGGARPYSTRTADLTQSLRAALLEQHGDKSLPAVLSGHNPDGSRVEGPHVAFVALPFVNHEHADGSIQGLAIVPPRQFTTNDRQTLLRLIAKWELTRGTEGRLEIASPGEAPVTVRRTGTPAKSSLRPSLWSRRARRFVTATPIALDRYPGDLRANGGGGAAKAAVEAQRSIADAVERIGLPRPTSVTVSDSPFIPGPQPARHFRPRPGRPARVRVHAEIRFGEPVEGPILLGAGRYFGLGLCLPLIGNES